jgi:hypothetical protein
MKKNYDKKFKAKDALVALKEGNTMAELSSKYSVPGHRISIWEKDAKVYLSEAFENKSKSKKQDDEDLTHADDLLNEIGHIKVENEF